MRSVRQPIEGMKEVVTDVVDPGTGGGQHVDVHNVFNGSRPSHPRLRIVNVVGDPPATTIHGGDYTTVYIYG